VWTEEYPIAERSDLMASKAKIMGHPIHPMLVTLPIGMWVFGLISDIVFRLGGGLVWRDTAARAIGVGVIAALVAAIPGLIDLLSWAKSRVKSIGIAHGALNVLAVAAFAVSYFLRVKAFPLLDTAFVFAIIGTALIAVSGWLGGTMVYVYRAALEPHAAPGPGAEAREREKETVSAGKE